MRLLLRMALIAISLSFVGCATSKDILYFQDIDAVQPVLLAAKYEAVIKKDDELKIIISGPDKAVTDPYNMTLADVSVGFTTNNAPETPMMSYLVDADGNINFPILGRIHVEGLTRIQLIDYLTREIGKDVKDPIVYVSFKNYKITVLGEVRSPGTYTYNSEKITVLQAIGYAGDLTVTAMRDGIILLREEDGVLRHIKIDLRDSSILDSPYYYLQQNDVLYVPPSSTRLVAANSATGLWSTILSSVSTVIAVIGLIVK